MKAQCPECQSDAIYRYGRTSEGKQRFICLICDRQFVANPQNVRFINKPHCPKCKKPMYSYMKGIDYIRFRCSNYPQCKTYLKVNEVEFEIVDAVMISKDLSIEQFLNEVQGKPLWETFHLANEEATAAERLLMQAKTVKKKSAKRSLNISRNFPILCCF